MRNRGARIADIAILIVSSEEGVKTQTIEAIKTIVNEKVPYIVALTKIDKPNSNIEKVKSELLEQGVYVEGFGGDIPCIPISSKTGAGINDILETILLLAEFQEFTGDPTKLAEGFVVEANMDEKRGVSATLIIKDGTIKKGQFIVVETAMATTRIIEDFSGATIDEATFSSPIRITGFSSLPSIGSPFQVLETKKDAEEYVRLAAETIAAAGPAATATITDETKIIPIIIKSDVYGSAEAIDAEISKLSTDEVYFKVIKKGVGTINESDVQLGLSDHRRFDRRAGRTGGGGGLLPDPVRQRSAFYQLVEAYDPQRGDEDDRPLHYRRPLAFAAHCRRQLLQRHADLPY
jgi:translation initiation factor IF-2